MPQMHLSDFEEEELTSSLRGPDGTPGAQLIPRAESQVLALQLMSLRLWLEASVCVPSDPSLPPNFMPTLRRQFIATNETTDVALNAYDMVWATAAAFAGAARAEGSSKSVPSGVGTMKALPQISFQGASGFVSFEQNGDRGIKNHQLEITNLVWDEAEKSYSSVIVGVVRFVRGEDVEIELNESPDPVLTWPDGSKYPAVWHLPRP